MRPRVRRVAPLAGLEAVRRAGFMGSAMLTFIVGGKRRFEIAPARGIDPFLNAFGAHNRRSRSSFRPPCGDSGGCSMAPSKTTERELLALGDSPAALVTPYRAEDGPVRYG
jgi:hypothetical protein